MKVSTRGRYALRFLVDMAQREERGYISLKEIADRQSISKKYLEQIVPILNQAGLLKTNRGSRGGYCLARPPKDITVADVLRATEGGLAPVSCVAGSEPDCDHYEQCTTYDLWKGLSEVVENYLSSVTIADLVAKSRTIVFDDYCI